MQQLFKWDNYSDQPYQLKDRAYKKKMRKRCFFSLFKTFLTAVIVLPISLILTPFKKNKTIDNKKFFTLGVDFQREIKSTKWFIEELGVESLLVRFKLWEMDSLNELKEFLSACKDKHIVLKIMQDRKHIEDKELLGKNLDTIFLNTKEYVDIFEIGSTINRAKWGFFCVDEYLSFFQVAYKLKKQKYPNIKLIGSGVIDFEYHFTAHTLFNLYNFRYDGISSLLYVDRRGAPENTQMGFSLLDKISLLATMIKLSPKTKDKLYITETNYPLKNTAPYAPTSEFECVSPKDYASFMLRYYLLGFATQQVELISWHQLIAPGYGLIDNREGIRKYPAFLTYKTMIKRLKNVKFLSLHVKRDYYVLNLDDDGKLLQVHWSLKPTTIENHHSFTVYDKDDKLIKEKILQVGTSPLYIYVKEDYE